MIKISYQQPPGAIRSQIVVHEIFGPASGMMYFSSEVRQNAKRGKLMFMREKDLKKCWNSSNWCWRVSFPFDKQEKQNYFLKRIFCLQK